jgi:outer membrane protein assembly factor BamD (BamD/ComL family)
MFMEAESYFFANRYPQANDGYNALVKKYVNTRFLDRLIRHQFAIARYWEQYHQAEPHWPITPNLLDKTRHLFDTRGHALKTYESIRLNDPTGPLADDAVMATANSHFLAGRWGDADYYYGQLREEYPDSDYQLQAHLLGLQCKLMRYQGPDYEDTPLVEARELVKQLLTQFPEELGDERKRVLEIREQLAASMALRDWTLAQFYEGKSQYGAARYYYTQMIRDYPTTKLAEEARQRMAAIADEPDTPPNYFQWLEDALPSNRNETIISAQPRETTTR